MDAGGSGRGGYGGGEAVSGKAPEDRRSPRRSREFHNARVFAQRFGVRLSSGAFANISVLRWKSGCVTLGHASPPCTRTSGCVLDKRRDAVRRAIGADGHRRGWRGGIPQTVRAVGKPLGKSGEGRRSGNCFGRNRTEWHE